MVGNRVRRKTLLREDVSERPERVRAQIQPWCYTHVHASIEVNPVKERVVRCFADVRVEVPVSKVRGC